jgi:hypothetical protein
LDLILSVIVFLLFLKREEKEGECALENITQERIGNNINYEKL